MILGVWWTPVVVYGLYTSWARWFCILVAINAYKYMKSISDTILFLFFYICKYKHRLHSSWVLPKLLMHVELVVWLNLYRYFRYWHTNSMTMDVSLFRLFYTLVDASELHIYFRSSMDITWLGPGRDDILRIGLIEKFNIVEGNSNFNHPAFMTSKPTC